MGLEGPVLVLCAPAGVSEVPVSSGSDARRQIQQAFRITAVVVSIDCDLRKHWKCQPSSDAQHETRCQLKGVLHMVLT